MLTADRQENSGTPLVSSDKQLAKPPICNIERGSGSALLSKGRRPLNVTLSKARFTKINEDRVIQGCVLGIDITGLRTLFLLKRLKLADFSRTVTLGRHEVFFHKGEFAYIRKRSGVAIEFSDEFSGGSFQEPLLQAFGARSIESIDASDYEGATTVLDFNAPIPPLLHGRFSLYLDFGSIEHIFNTPQVVLNANNLIGQGGTAVILTDASGNAGHGFYQFSPEFFYSAFSEENGFGNTRVYLIDANFPKYWRFVRSPAVLRARNDIPHRKRWVILCVTEKTRSVDVVTAQQSDYANISWDTKDHRHHPDHSRRWYQNGTQLNPYLYTAFRSFYYALKNRRRFADQTVTVDPEMESRRAMDMILHG